MRTKLERDHYIDPQSWLAETPSHEGSWWPEWAKWLIERSGAPPPRMGAAAPLAAAPGTYVLKR